MSNQIKKSAKKSENRNKFTEPVTPSSFETSRIIFDAPQEKTIPNSTMSYYTIPIAYKNENGTEGDFVLELPDCPSYGINESLDMKTKVLKGYTAGMTFGEYKQTLSEISQEFKDCISAFSTITDICKKHLLQPEVYEECGLEMLVEPQLIGMSPMTQKKKDVNGKKKTDPESHYSIYPKLYWNAPKNYEDKKGNQVSIPSRFQTEIWDDNEAQLGNKVDLDPLQLLEKRGRIRPFVKIESIYIGSGKFKVQLKLYAAGYAVAEQTSGYKSLFRFDKKNTLTTLIINKNDEEEQLPAASTQSKNDPEEEVFTVTQKQVVNIFFIVLCFAK